MSSSRWRRSLLAVMMAAPCGVAAAPPARPGSATRPSPTGNIASERVTFTTDDKTPITIVGTYCPPATGRERRCPMAILLHAYGESRANCEPLARELHRAGLAVLAVDLRGHGESVEPASLKLEPRALLRDPRLFRDMDHDVEAACRWLMRRPEVDPARFVLVGAGIGGSVALAYAARDKSVDGVLIMSPVLEDAGLDALAAARKYEGRKLLLVAGPDERSAADELARVVPGAIVKVVPSRSDSDAATRSSTPRLGPEGRHGDAATAEASHLSASPRPRVPASSSSVSAPIGGIERTITEFLIQAAGPPSTKPVVASLKGQVYYDSGSKQADQLSPDNLRAFSSPAEAESRGYRPPKQRKK